MSDNFSNEEFGIFAVGVYQGLDTTNERFPKLLLLTNPEPGAKAQAFDFKPFDSATGRQNLPESVQVGDRVQVRLWVGAKAYTDKETGERKAFAQLVVQQVQGF